MLEALKAFGLVFGVGLGLWYGVAKFFKFVEDGLNAETKGSIAEWLRGDQAPGIIFTDSPPKAVPHRWPDTFAIIFDRVFTKYHFSWKCFYRSCIASVLAVIVTSILLVMLSIELFPKPWSDLNNLELIIILLMAATFNIVPDYISLLETRWMLSKLENDSAIRVLVLTLDLIMTSAIAMFSVYFLMMYIPIFLGGSFYSEALQCWC